MNTFFSNLQKAFKAVIAWFASLPGKISHLYKKFIAWIRPVFTKKYTLRDILTFIWFISFFVISAVIIFL
jgi:hypothetical protein